MVKASLNKRGSVAIVLIWTAVGFTLLADIFLSRVNTWIKVLRAILWNKLLHKYENSLQHFSMAVGRNRTSATMERRGRPDRDDFKDKAAIS